MPNKMLIDASHPEETRVVVVRGNRVEEAPLPNQPGVKLRRTTIDEVIVDPKKRLEERK